MNKAKIKRFINNDFESAVLSGEIIDGKFKANLLLEGPSKLDHLDTIPSYGIDLKMSDIELCRHLVETFINNNPIKSVYYNDKLPRHLDKIGITMYTKNKSFSMAFPIELYKMFPNLIDQIEQSKKQFALDYVMEKDITRFQIKLDTLTYHTGTCTILKDDFIYEPLRIRNKDGYVIDREGEMEFAKFLLKQFIEKNPCDYDAILRKIDGNSYGWIKFPTFKFIFYSKEELELLRETIQELRNKTDDRQLMFTLGGKIL